MGEGGSDGDKLANGLKKKMKSGNIPSLWFVMTRNPAVCLF